MRTDQRERLLRAVVSLVAARGFTQVTVREVAWAAGVSYETLYEHFAGVGDALLTACDAALEELLAGVERAVAAEARWSEGVWEGLRCLLDGVAAEPAVHWCCFVGAVRARRVGRGVPAAGARAVEPR